MALYRCGGGSGGEKKTLLWENDTPQVCYGLELNIDPSYDYILLMYKTLYSDNYEEAFIIEKEVDCSHALTILNGLSVQESRAIEYIPATQKISIDIGTHPGTLVPQRIYGVKGKLLEE